MLELRSEAMRAGQFAPISAGKFSTFGGGGSTVVYAQAADKDGTLRRVFVQRSRGNLLEIALAQRATHAYSEGGDLQVITLYDGERYEGIPGERKFRIVRFAENTHPGAPAGAVGRRAAARTEFRPRCSQCRATRCSAPNFTGAWPLPIMARGHGAHRRAARAAASAPGPLRARGLRHPRSSSLHPARHRRQILAGARRHARVVRPVVGACARSRCSPRRAHLCAALAGAPSLSPQHGAASRRRAAAA